LRHPRICPHFLADPPIGAPQAFGMSLGRLLSNQGLPPQLLRAANLPR
jgi:hypothetical protein